VSTALAKRISLRFDVLGTCNLKDAKRTASPRLTTDTADKPAWSRWHIYKKKQLNKEITSRNATLL